MLRTALAKTLLFAVGITALQAATSAQQKRWAATDPSSDGSAVVVWGDSKEQAQQRATQACQRVSKTCANGPASTDTQSDVFALMCCTQPKLGCAVGVGPDRKQALDSIKATFASAGFANCSLRQYISAQTGKRL